MKQHIQTTLRAALIAAGCLVGASAWSATTASDEAPAKPSASMTQGSDYGNAADKADANKVQPSREAVQEGANRPSTSVLDDNVQRQHDRDQGSTQRPSDDTAGTTHQAPDNGAAGASSGGMDSGASPGSDSGTSGATGSGTDSGTAGMSSSRSGMGSPATRDWDKIDTNHDNSVSPQEMDSWLKNGRSQESAPQK